MGFKLWEGVDRSKLPYQNLLMANVQPFPIDIYIDIELPKEFYIYREIYRYIYIDI